MALIEQTQEQDVRESSSKQNVTTTPENTANESSNSSEPGKGGNKDGVVEDVCPLSETVTAEDDGAHDEEEARDIEAQLTRQTTIAPVHSVFPKKQKQFIVFMVAWGGFFSAISANIYFPVLNALAAKFHTTNAIINLTLTSYMICQGLAPTVFGDLADMAGRRPAYALGFIIYIAANIGIALSNSFASVLIFRCIQSTGSSSTIALASGIVGDIATSSERGTWMGWAVTGPMIAPSLGPVVGGLLSQFLGWRSVFWFLVIMAVTFIIPFLILFPETGRNVVGNGSIPPQTFNMSLLNYLARRREEAKESDPLSRTRSRESNRLAQATLARQRKLRWPNPLNSMRILAEKDIFMLLFYNALVFCAFYDVTASAPYMFAETYGYNDLQVGLAFLPFGAGCVLAPMSCGRLLDWNYRRNARKAGIAVDRKREADLSKFPLEKARLQVALPLVYIGSAAVLCYGWVLDVETSIAAPLVMMFLVGWCFTSSFNSMSTMLVDFYPNSPATAIAANNLVRCEMGAGATAVIIYMIDTMGRGWCFTFIAGVLVAFSPMLWVLLRWGPKWREERRLRTQKQIEGKRSRGEQRAARAEGAPQTQGEKSNAPMQQAQQDTKMSDDTDDKKENEH